MISWEKRVRKKGDDEYLIRDNSGGCWIANVSEREMIERIDGLTAECERVVAELTAARQTTRWILLDETPYGQADCEACESEFSEDTSLYSYCPFCGARITERV